MSCALEAIRCGAEGNHDVDGNVDDIEFAAQPAETSDIFAHGRECCPRILLGAREKCQSTNPPAGLLVRDAGQFRLRAIPAEQFALCPKTRESREGLVAFIGIQQSWGSIQDGPNEKQQAGKAEQQSP